MALDTYTGLLASIASNLHRTGDAELLAVTPDFVTSCEAAMNRRLRVREMIARAQANVSTEYVAVPADFKAAITMTLSDGQGSTWKVTPQPIGVIADAKTSTTVSRPRFYAVVGSQLRFFPAPDQAYTAEYDYYRTVPPLALNSTNWMLQASPDAYLYGSLSYAGVWTQDPDMLSVWRGLFDQAMDEVKLANRPTAGPLRVDPGLTSSRRYDIRTDC